MLYHCPLCSENIEFGGIIYTAQGECCALCTTPLLFKGFKGDVPTLIWNEDSDWAIPLPKFIIGQLTNKGRITAHRFIPDETPIIPTGWEFRVNGHWFYPWELVNAT